jgi:cytoskeletal protein CcmA (bactofilin family)
VLGSVFRSADHLQISNLHEIDDDLYAFCQRVDIDGSIRGDLFVFSMKTSINGRVTESASLFCRNVRQSGRIDGSLRVFAEDCVIEGPVGRSALLFCGNVHLGRGAVIGHGLNAYGGDIEIDGTVRGNTHVEANKIHISGTLEGDVELKAKKITIAPSAIINGNLTYKGAEEDALNVRQGATVTGEIIWEQLEDEETDDGTSVASSIAFKVSSLLAAFLFGLLVTRLFRPYFEESFRQLYQRTSVSLAAGFLAAAISLIALIALFLAVLFTGIAMLLIVEDQAAGGSILLILSSLMLPISSFFGLSSMIMLYTGRIVVGFVIGYLILNSVRGDTKHLSATGLFIGLLVVTLLWWIPYLGAVLYLATALFGAGAILLGLKHCRERALAFQEKVPGSGDSPPSAPPQATPPPSAGS